VSDTLDPVAFLSSGPGGAERQASLARLRRLQRRGLSASDVKDVETRVQTRVARSTKRLHS